MARGPNGRDEPLEEAIPPVGDEAFVDCRREKSETMAGEELLAGEMSLFALVGVSKRGGP